MYQKPKILVKEYLKDICTSKILIHEILCNGFGVVWCFIWLRIFFSGTIGTGQATKTNEFSENFQRRGGGGAF